MLSLSQLRQHKETATGAFRLPMSALSVCGINPTYWGSRDPAEIIR